MKAITTILIICITLTNVSCQNSALMKDANYKNMNRNLELCEQFVEKGDLNNAFRRLTYAQKFSKKLIEKGYESEIGSELERIVRLEKSLQKTPTNPKTITPKNKSTTSETITMKSSDFRNWMNEMEDKKRNLEWLINANPTENNFTNYNNKVVLDFDRKATLETIQMLRSTDASQVPHHKRHLKTLDDLETLITNFETTFINKGIYKKIDNALAKAKTEEGQMSIYYIKNTMKFIEILKKLSPQSSQLIDKLAKAKTLLQEQEQQVAAKEKADKQPAQNIATELPVAGMSDGRLESEFKQLAKTQIRSDLSITKVIITSSSWGINKDAVGRPIDRMMIAAMIMKDNDGKCYTQHFVFKQLASGNSFGRTNIDNSWGKRPLKVIDCGLVK